MSFSCTMTVGAPPGRGNDICVRVAGVSSTCAGPPSRAPMVIGKSVEDTRGVGHNPRGRMTPQGRGAGTQEVVGESGSATL